MPEPEMTAMYQGIYAHPVPEPGFDGIGLAFASEPTARCTECGRESYLRGMAGRCGHFVDGEFCEGEMEPAK